MVNQLQPGLIEQHLALLRLRQLADTEPLTLCMALVIFTGIHEDMAVAFVKGLRERLDTQELVNLCHQQLSPPLE